MSDTVHPVHPTWTHDGLAFKRRPDVPRPDRHLKLIHREDRTEAILSRRDPEFIRSFYPVAAAISDHYFRAEVNGSEHLSDQAGIMAATHNGGMLMPDLFCLMVAFWRRFGLETPGFGMIHAMALKVPYFAKVFTKLGAVPANKENARVVLRSGYPLLLCPGGDIDSLKPFSRRHHICFGERRGFIRLAIEQQVPIIPVVSVGAHETLFVLNDGRWLAEISGAAKYLRIKTIPFSFSFPFGLTPAGLLAIPLPSKIRLQILPKIELHELPQASNNPAVVERCFEHIRGKMQKALDELASTRKHIILG